MDAIMTDPDISYFDSPPVLVAGSSETAVARARLTIEAFGLRLAAGVLLGDASARLHHQASASALWVELDEFDATADAFLREVNAGVNAGRYPAIVAAPKHLIDPLAAILDDEVQLLVDADDAQRACALAIAVATREQPLAIADIAADRNAERLRQLSDEVSRIASTLARLSTGPTAQPQTIERAPIADVPEVSAETVRSVIRARRLRARYFPEDLFADPAWDMLLDLLQAEIAQLRVPVSSLCIAAAVPATTALRWLKTMVQQDLFVRRADPNDRRRVFIELTPRASQGLRRYFAEVGSAVAV